jgi:hypothetical protein
VDFANASTGSTDLVVDVTGYFATGLGYAFIPITPVRVLDTRLGGGKPVAAFGTEAAPVLTGGAIGLGAANAVAANVTVTGPAAGGYVAAYPDGENRPITSVLNFNRGQTIPNATTVAVGGDAGSVLLYNGSPGTAHLIVDVFGLYN